MSSAHSRPSNQKPIGRLERRSGLIWTVYKSRDKPAAFISAQRLRSRDSVSRSHVRGRRPWGLYFAGSQPQSLVDRTCTTPVKSIRAELEPALNGIKVGSVSQGEITPESRFRSSRGGHVPNAQPANLGD